jgi:hypothetical protein
VFALLDAPWSGCCCDSDGRFIDKIKDLSSSKVRDKRPSK